MWVTRRPLLNGLSLLLGLGRLAAQVLASHQISGSLDEPPNLSVLTDLSHPFPEHGPQSLHLHLA